MQILLAISVLCCLASILATAAAMRHIRAKNRPAPMRIDERSFAEHLIAEHTSPILRRGRPAPAQTIQEIMRNKSWNQPAEAVTVHPGQEPHLTTERKAPYAKGQRKAPQSSGCGSHPDWTYFNKDLGDLSDPYETPRLHANSGYRFTSTKRR